MAYELFRLSRSLNTRSRSAHSYREQAQPGLAAANNEYLYGTTIRLRHWLRAPCSAIAALARRLNLHRRRLLSIDSPSTLVSWTPNPLNKFPVTTPVLLK